MVRIRPGGPRCHYDYIEAENPRAAIAVDDRISRQVQRLKQFPESGRLGRIEGTRELVIHNTPYIAAYRSMRGTVRILCVAWCPTVARRHA